jgi:hypothetical protein
MTLQISISQIAKITGLNLHAWALCQFLKLGKNQNTCIVHLTMNGECRTEVALGESMSEW